MVIAAVLAAMLVTGLGTWYLTKQSASKPVAQAPVEIPAPAPATAPVAEPQQAAPAAPAAVTPQVPRYYVVLGSFEVDQNVTNLVSKLSTQGLSPKTLPALRNGLTPVAAADFETLTEAYNFMQRLNDFEEFWVLKQ